LFWWLLFWFLGVLLLFMYHFSLKGAPIRFWHLMHIYCDIT
jgi:hypothetical protein